MEQGTIIICVIGGLIVLSGIHHLIHEWIKIQPEIQRAKRAPVIPTKKDEE